MEPNVYENSPWAAPCTQGQVHNPSDGCPIAVFVQQENQQENHDADNSSYQKLPNDSQNVEPSHIPISISAPNQTLDAPNGDIVAPISESSHVKIIEQKDHEKIAISENSIPTNILLWEVSSGMNVSETDHQDLYKKASSVASISTATATDAVASTSCKGQFEGESGTGLRKSTRNKKRPLSNEPTIVCPNCGLSVKSDDLPQHFEVEVNKLDKLCRHRKSYDHAKRKAPVSSTNPDSEDFMDSHTRYKNYLTIRTRRERRHKNDKAKRGEKRPGEEETECPVCNEKIIGIPEELAEHVDQCLQQQASDDELDIEGEENFEEYTWAGQTRIRASSLMEGGMAASGFSVAKKSECDEDEGMDLDIDGDDSNLYGAAQYTEADLIPCSEEEAQHEKERKALRNAVLRGEGSKPSRSVPEDRQRWQHANTTAGDKRIQKDCETNGELEAPSTSEVIDSLKAKLRDQEAQLQKIEQPKCLICMDWYTKPLTSLQCWHVHCEECWLRTLGTKKLCPQCNMITSPTDLRRIYL